MLNNIPSIGGTLLIELLQTKLDVPGVSGLFDSKIGSNLKLGLFSYPVLQAADILVHRYVSLDIQCQHL